MIFTGGQVDLDPQGSVRNPGNLKSQCTGVLEYLDVLLKELGADFEDVVKFIAYFVGDETDEQELLQQIAERVGSKACPAISTICLGELCYPGMMLEIEAIAMRSEDGSRLERQCFHLAGMPKLPTEFSHVVRCGEMIFTGDVSAMNDKGEVIAASDIVKQSSIMMDQLTNILAAVGADMGDVLKLNVFYCGKGNAEEWEKPAAIRAKYFPDPGPAATGIPVPSFPQSGLMTKISVIAMRGTDGDRLEKQYAWPEGHWDWTTPLPYKHGNKCGKIIHLGGQVSLDSKANVMDPNNMVAQTRTAMDNIAKVLAEFGATLDDVVKVTTFYQGSASADELHQNLLIRSGSYTEPGPATTGIPVPGLVYESMVIEIEVTAMIDN